MDDIGFDGAWTMEVKAQHTESSQDEVGAETHQVAEIWRKKGISNLLEYCVYVWLLSLSTILRGMNNISTNDSVDFFYTIWPIAIPCSPATEYNR